MTQKSIRLTAASYLTATGDKTKLTKTIVLTPVPWIAQRLAGSAALKNEWKANKSVVYPGVHAGKKMFDIVNCLPGASMALITMDEAIAAGARDVRFIGTAASVKGIIKYGEVRMDGRIASVLNPFQEHEQWEKIGSMDFLDMEVNFLKSLAKNRGVSFRWALIVLDAMWRRKWEYADQGSMEFQDQINKSIKKLIQWLAI